MIIFMIVTWKTVMSSWNSSIVLARFCSSINLENFGMRTDNCRSSRKEKMREVKKGKNAGAQKRNHCRRLKKVHCRSSKTCNSWIRKTNAGSQKKEKIARAQNRKPVSPDSGPSLGFASSSLREDNATLSFWSSNIAWSRPIDHHQHIVGIYVFSYYNFVDWLKHLQSLGPRSKISQLQIQNNQSPLEETEKIVNVKIITIINTITSTLLCYISLFFGY